MGDVTIFFAGTNIFKYSNIDASAFYALYMYLNIFCQVSIYIFEYVCIDPYEHIRVQTTGFSELVQHREVCREMVPVVFEIICWWFADK